MAAHLAHRGHAGHRLAATPEIGAFPRQVHPRLVAFRRDDGLEHGPLAPVHGRDLVLHAGGVALRPEIARGLAEGTLHHPLVGLEQPFDDHLGIRRDEEVVAPGGGRREPEGLLHVAADDVELAHLERAAVARAHVVGRVMPQHGGHGTLHVVILVVLEDLPQVPRRGVQRGALRRLDLHAMVRAVVDAGSALLGDGGHDDVGAAVHVMVPHHRDLVDVHVLAGLGVLHDRRLVVLDDHRLDAVLLALQADVGHDLPARVLVEPERHLGLALGDLAVHGQLDVRRLPMKVQRIVEDQDGEFPQLIQVLDERAHVVVRRVHLLGYVDHLVGNLPTAVFQKRSQALGHVSPLSNVVDTCVVDTCRNLRRSCASKPATPRSLGVLNRSTGGCQIGAGVCG